MKKIILTIAGLFLFLTLNGCSEENKSHSSSQVAAKVNDDEITVHQVNQLMRKVNTPVEEGVSQQEMANKILDKLIDQEILLQEAKKMNLDRDIEVLSLIEEAKRKILVDAYLNRMLQGEKSVSDEDIKRYFEANTKYFTNRKVFSYTQVLIPATADEQNALAEKVKEFNDVDAFTKFLDEQGKPYKMTFESKGSENLSAPLLEPMYAIKPGDIGFLKLSDGLLMIKLTQVNDQPVTYEEAQLAIKRFLAGQQQKQASEKMVEKLRENAKIEYVGDFSSIQK